MRRPPNPRIDFAYDSNLGESLGGISERNGRQREMATFRYRWRLFAEQAQGNSLESHQSHTLATFSVTGTSMVMGETSSDFDMLGVLASKIRVWRCVDILFVRFRVCSENIPFFHTDSSDFQVVPCTFELPHPHTHPSIPRLPHRSAHALPHHAHAPPT